MEGISRCKEKPGQDWRGSGGGFLWYKCFPVRIYPYQRTLVGTIVPSTFKGCMKVIHTKRSCGCVLSRFSCVQLCVTPWAIACQAPLSMGLSRQKYWSRLPFPFPGNLPNPGSKPHLLCLLHWQVDSLPLVPSGKPNEA